MRSPHRPWPRPRLPWVMEQVWTDLLFAHWRVPHELLRPHVPAALELERRDGAAWLGIVPFDLARLRARALPPIPGMSRFPELNVRTYVSVDGKPGVFFFSLDAASPGAVMAARTFFRLPYRHAEMAIARDGGLIEYRCQRRGAPLRFRGRYGPTGPAYEAAPGSLDEWLTERHCLYTMIAGRPWRLEIDHAPWPLQPARAEIEENTMAAPLGLPFDGPPILHFAARQEMVGWLPYPCG